MRDLYHGTVYDITEIDVNQGILPFKSCVLRETEGRL